ncbi:MAG: TetR/AcrR family transcriptional regulator [Candidatus Nanohaloarchaea archaeon]
MPDTRENIMDATFQVLCEEGYAGLSIQDIADRIDREKSSIYYHFDDKQDLMLSFLDHMAEQIEKEQCDMEDRPPRERLDRLLDMMLGTEEDRWQFQKAFQELKVKAQSDREFAGKFRKIDGRMAENLADLLDELDAEDPEESAEIVLSLIEGAVSRKTATQEKEGLEELRDAIDRTVNEIISRGSS